jgi:hypothetical protein
MCASVLQYNSFDDLERDFIQMCRNAQKYNEEASLIHEDSIVLETVFANARVRLEQDSEPAEEEEEEEGEENPGSGKKKLFLSILFSCVLPCSCFLNFMSETVEFCIE